MSFFGKLITGAIDIVALPLKIGEEVTGRAIGSDRHGLKDAMPVPSDVTDKLKDIVEQADEED